MAKASWLIVSPESGSGNTSIKNSATPHTGRIQRTTTVEIVGVGVSNPVTYTVHQEPKLEFVQFQDGSEMSASKGASTVTVTGTTNSNKLTFSWVGSGQSVSIPTTYLANGVNTSNGGSITGDPGAVSEFNFSVSLSFPANTSISEVVRNLKVVANGGQSVQIAIKQAAGDAYLTVEPVEITIPQSGDGVSVDIKTNTSWTIS